MQGAALLTLCCLLVCLQHTLAEKGAPSWPPHYKVSFNMTVPYINRLQSSGFEYQYTFWRDLVKGKQRMERDGTEIKILDLTMNKQYDIFPAKDHYICWVGEIKGATGPTLQGEQPPAAQAVRRKMMETVEGSQQEPENQKWNPADIAKLGFVLPDLTEDRWQRNGTDVRNGKEVVRYTYMLKENYGYGTVHSQYDFLVTYEGAPVELLMWGINLYSGGHFDDYRTYFYNYSVGPIAEEQFEIPIEICKEDNTVHYDVFDVPHDKPKSSMDHVAAVLPNPHYGDPEYDVFVHRAGRRHTSSTEYHQRKQVYYGNKNYIEEFNGGNHSYTLSMNKWGDWTREERRTLFRTKSERHSMFGSSNKDYKYMLPHEPVVPYHMLPSSVDWRDTLADSPVKDQAACGACWAFSTIASLETGYYRATGKQLLLSEQHLLDCGWNAPPQHGCFGGDQDMAMEFLFEQGIIATEESYPYIGVFDFCKNESQYQGVKFSGHWRLVPRGEKPVMEALVTKGTLTTSIDASADDMTFYASGVYTNPACKTEEADLDHAVMLSGYGETEEGVKYWIVKNTWSTYWGEEGYLRVERTNDDCGISTQVMYAEMTIIEDVPSN